MTALPSPWRVVSRDEFDHGEADDGTPYRVTAAVHTYAVNGTYTTEWWATTENGDA